MGVKVADSVVLYPDPILLSPCAPVPAGFQDDPEWYAALRGMLGLMVAHGGCGLAGPQAGVPHRVFLMATHAPVETDTYFGSTRYTADVVINPEVLSSEGSAAGKERCLSLPGVDYNVRRAYRVRARWLDHTGAEAIRTLDGWPARVFQHELDHLDGVLINAGGAPHGHVPEFVDARRRGLRR